MVAMSSFLEAMVLLLPPDAGGRAKAVAPREGSYRPFARIGQELVRLRIIEGPPSLAPGDGARVVIECDADRIREGEELQILELDERVVGQLTVLRVIGKAAMA